MERINLINKEQDPDLWELSMSRFLYKFTRRFDNREKPYDVVEFLDELYRNELNYLDQESLFALAGIVVDKLY